MKVPYLVSQIGSALAEEVDNLVTALGHDKERGLQQIQTAVDNVRKDEEGWRHKARLAIVALYLGEFGPATDMLEFENRDDPIQRTVFIDTFADWHGNLQQLKQQLADADHPGLRSGICLAVGSVEDIAQEAKSAWQRLLEKWYAIEPDSGTHSAAKWALRHWQYRLPPIDHSQLVGKQPAWEITERTGLTMIRISAPKFLGFRVAVVSSASEQGSGAESGSRQAVGGAGLPSWSEGGADA